MPDAARCEIPKLGSSVSKVVNQSPSLICFRPFKDCRMRSFRPRSFFRANVRMFFGGALRRPVGERLSLWVNTACIPVFTLVCCGGELQKNL